MEEKLTKKQAAFVKEYLIDLNATQAAIRAGYSKKTAGITGHENLNKPKIAAKIEKAMSKRAKRTEITQDEVLKELARIGFANISDFVKVVESHEDKKEPILDKNGKEIGTQIITRVSQTVKIEPTENLDEDRQAAIASIKEGRNGIEVRLNDKIRALELMGRHLGMFQDNINLTGAVGVTMWEDPDQELEQESYPDQDQEADQSD